MGRDLVCSAGQFHFTVMPKEASQDMAIPTLVFDFQGGSRQSSVHTDTSSSDPTGCRLQPQTCSLYPNWSISVLFERLVGVPFNW